MTGCPNSGIREKTIRVIEELGADVVAFDCCNGTREKVEKVDTENMRCVATGYGRVCVDYADKVVTEITCHGKGGFAESEVIGHIGAGKAREDIAAGVIDSVAVRVSNLLVRYGAAKDVVLTGGLCDSPYFLEVFSEKAKRKIQI